MKTTTKTKVLKALDKIQGIVEKCGGRGGTPGPCPIGNKPSGGGGGHSEKMRAVAPHAQKARALSEKAHIASMQAPEVGHSRKAAKQALDASKLAVNSGKVNQSDAASAKAAFQNHRKAAEYHLAAAKMHTNIGVGVSSIFGGNPHMEGHMNAADAHEAAAKQHRETAFRYATVFKGVTGF